MQVTLGGDRLGSGNKNKIALRNYERSTHNLSQKYTSSMQVGTLYPFLVLPAMRGDKFSIKLEADARTIPTKGPLFGSFKMQVDLFQCDVRLYQAILHNNPLAIGLKMNQVKFPRLMIKDGLPGTNSKTSAFSNSSLMKYLGMSGIGHPANNVGQYGAIRYVNAIPALAYYEIFKTYYSNKQEENAYIIGTEILNGDAEEWVIKKGPNTLHFDTTYPVQSEMIFNIDLKNQPRKGWEKEIYISFLDDNENLIGGINLYNSATIDEPKIGILTETEKGYIYKLKELPIFPSTAQIVNFQLTYLNAEYKEEIRGLQPFKLANIDAMRLKLLSHHTLGSPFTISNSESSNSSTWSKADGIDQTGLPYTNLVDMYTDEETTFATTFNAKPLNGLVVKTYQSDLFNNWVNTEWIDGENGIANVTAISTASGSIKIDSINLSEKLYNMLNRIAVSDGSYEGWQDAVYTETPKRHIESPIYLGGMSSEIVFEEIVQSAPADGQPLGTLGGKGKLIKNKGGYVNVKVNEAAFIIGIVSLTPRVNYSQGNEFYLTDLMSMDDFHKPALDGIGFQNLIGERLAWWDTEIGPQGTTQRHTIGKVPAWIEYMTAVDKTYGDFAETEGRGFMALNREYTREGNEIADATTYIDPRKYNYAFAVSDIEAQNFWVQIYSDIKARRLMSAKQIPNI